MPEHRGPIPSDFRQLTLHVDEIATVNSLLQREIRSTARTLGSTQRAGFSDRSKKKLRDLFALEDKLKAQAPAAEESEDFDDDDEEI